MGEVATVIDETGNWYDTIVGEDEDRGKAMAEFETPEAFFESHDALVNKDWRTDIAGDDTKYMAELQRFETPLDYGNSNREAQQKIRSGNLAAVPGPEATDEDIATYREANGIPKEVEGYFQDLPEGTVIGEADKEIFEDFFGVLHGKQVKPEVTHEIINWYNDFAESEQAAEQELDATQSTETNDQLREDWGADYRANMNLVQGVIKTFFGKEASEQLLNGRYMDRRAFMNDPQVLQGFMSMARKLTPLMQLTQTDADPATTLNDEIAEIEKFMKDHRTEYMNDEKKQARLRDLYDIRAQHNAK